ncbi:MAG: Fur family transcriptional regulator [Bradyrhizobium sp.]
MDAQGTGALAGLLHEALPEAVVLKPATGGRANECARRLRESGLRPTRQRVVLTELLFGRGDRHVTAEMLFEEATGVGMYLSLTTVYNTLNQFTQAGLLRRIGPNGSKSFFDTNTSVHPHFYFEGEGRLVDVPERLSLEQMPVALPGHEISRLDIIIHIRRKPAAV